MRTVVSATRLSFLEEKESEEADGRGFAGVLRRVVGCFMSAPTGPVLLSLAGATKLPQVLRLTPGGIPCVL